MPEFAFAWLKMGECGKRVLFASVEIPHDRKKLSVVMRGQCNQFADPHISLQSLHSYMSETKAAYEAYLHPYHSQADCYAILPSQL